MNRWIIIMVLCGIAFLNAGYLTYEACNFIFGSQLVCDISSAFSCSAVLSHPASRIFGIPFPAIALVVYPVLFTIAWLGWSGKLKQAMRVLMILSGLGMMFNGYIIYQEAFVIKAFCPLCLLCTGIIISIFVLSLTSKKAL